MKMVRACLALLAPLILPLTSQADESLSSPGGAAQGAWRLSLLDAYPALRLQTGAPAEGNNPLLNLVHFLEKDYPAIQLDTPISALADPVEWREEDLQAILKKHRDAINTLVAMGVGHSSSVAGISPAQMELLSGGSLREVRALLTFLTTSLAGQSDSTATTISLAALMGFAEVLRPDLTGADLAAESAEFERAAVDVFIGILFSEKSGREFDEVTLRRFESILGHPSFQDRMKDSIRKHWNQIMATRLTPEVLRDHGGLLPDGVRSHPRETATALAILATACMDQAATTSPYRYLDGSVRLPQWDAPEQLPEDARQWVEQELKITLSQGKLFALFNSRRDLAMAGIAVALGREAPGEAGTGEAYLIDASRKTLSLPAGVPGGIRTIGIPRVLR